MKIINIISHCLYRNYEILTYNKEKKIINNYSKWIDFIYKYVLLIIIIISFIFFCSYNFKYNIINYKNFINDCQKLKKYNRINVFNYDIPYISICIPAYNMEKYIEKALLTIINQSFSNFEIIIVNDHSSDNTEKIIIDMQSFDNRIKLIKHNINLGVYNSRKEAALNTNGKFIIFMDPDDMFLNPFLFEALYNYNLKYNLDMIEFCVFHRTEGKKRITLSIYHEFNHYHHYKKKIIYQPELSDIIFYIPNTIDYTPILCRTIWNKIVKRKIIINSIEYIEKYFNSSYLITADDTPINILNFHFAYNYSNIKLPGYLYNVRKNSMSRINIENKHDTIVSYNYLLYFILFYNYLKDFKKDFNFLFYDLKANYNYIMKFKELNTTNYFFTAIYFFKQLINDNISLDFKNFVKNLLREFRN